jgi:hypothetical protein
MASLLSLGSLALQYGPKVAETAQRLLQGAEEAKALYRENEGVIRNYKQIGKKATRLLGFDWFPQKYPGGRPQSKSVVAEELLEGPPLALSRKLSKKKKKKLKRLHGHGGRYANDMMGHYGMRHYGNNFVLGSIAAEPVMHGAGSGKAKRILRNVANVIKRNPVKTALGTAALLGAPALGAYGFARIVGPNVLPVAVRAGSNFLLKQPLF